MEFFEELNKIIVSQTDQEKKKKEGTMINLRFERGDSTADSLNTKKIIKNTRSLENLDEIDKFLDRQKLPKHTQ